MDALLEGLNEAQKSAVTSPASVVQVLAPPGSGKTKTLTARVAYHVNHERLKPWNIIVCTFTIKAAREMKERIRGFVGDKLESKLILGTFHSVARRFLSRYGQEIGIDKNFGIADTDDSKAIIKRIVKRYEYNVEPGHARSRISGLKAKGISADDFAKTTKRIEDNEFGQVYSSYQEHLKASNLLDYDDLLVRCVDLLRLHPSCVSTIQAVLIDEYQDTNNIQYELMTLMAQQAKKITIVGDPDQSIYSFRSAEIKNLLRMRVDYPEAVVINLEHNYRSSGCILSAALAVIEQDESRPEKPLIATHCVGEQPTLRHLASAHVEARWIVEEIKRSKTLTAGLLGYNDYAILVRTAALSLSVERELGRAGIPYRMVGGKRFFDRAEIKVILNYLRVVNNPDNNDAIVSVINTPSRKIGDKTVKSLLEEAEIRKVSLWTLVWDIAQGRRTPATKLSAPSKQGITLFFGLILTARKRLQPDQGDPWTLLDLITYIFEKTSFEAYLKQMHKENWKDRLANVDELIAQATQMATASEDGEEDDSLPVVEGVEQRPDTPFDMLSKFLVNVALATSVEKDEGEEVEQVTISTIHAAKGLEWPIVFIPAVYDGQLPHSRAENHDEERRLLYVGMTRAQALLYLSCPVKPSQQNGSEETTLSKFVEPKGIQKLFSQRGPDLAFNRRNILDLSTILGRPCPEEAVLLASRSQLEYLEDDKYPATREEIDGEGLSWGAPYDNNGNNGGPAGHKRQKLDEHRGYASGTTAAVPSGNTTGGFTSARDLQVILQETEQTTQPGKGRTYRNTGRRTAEEETPFQNEVRKLSGNAPQTKTAKPRAAGQGAITSFFQGAGRKLSETPEPAPKPAISSLKRSQSELSSHTPLQNVSNIRHTTSMQSKPFQPLSVPSYTLKNRPLPTKPKRRGSEPDDEKPRHALCLSSPTKPDEKSPIAIAGDDDDLEVVANPANTTVSSSTISGTRPASTFHTTSMSMVQNQQAQRKTLGTRRTMQGWSVKHSQMPKPRRP